LQFGLALVHLVAFSASLEVIDHADHVLTVVSHPHKGSFDALQEILLLDPLRHILAPQHYLLEFFQVCSLSLDTGQVRVFQLALGHVIPFMESLFADQFVSGVHSSSGASNGSAVFVTTGVVAPAGSVDFVDFMLDSASALLALLLDKSASLCVSPATLSVLTIFVTAFASAACRVIVTRPRSV